jgi:hypothetical protein
VKRTSPRGRGVEIHEKLEKSDSLEQNINEMVQLSRQAIELYRSSKQVSLYSKPIILYYSFAKLARILFLSTYQTKKVVGNHGLTLKDSSIIIKKSGAFARFHDSYIVPWHRGHSISISNSVNTGSSFCSGTPDSSIASRTFSSGSVFGGTSFVRPCLGMTDIYQK